MYLHACSLSRAPQPRCGAAQAVAQHLSGAPGRWWKTTQQGMFGGGAWMWLAVVCITEAAWRRVAAVRSARTRLALARTAGSRGQHAGPRRHSGHGHGKHGAMLCHLKQFGSRWRVQIAPGAGRPQHKRVGCCCSMGMGQSPQHKEPWQWEDGAQQAHVRMPRDIAMAALIVTMSSTVSRQVRPLSPLSVCASSGPPSLLSPPPTSGGALGRSDEGVADPSFLAACAHNLLRPYQWNEAYMGYMGQHAAILVESWLRMHRLPRSRKPR